MKNVILALVSSVALTGSALAAEYVGVDYQSKQRSGLDEQHDVFGVTVGSTLGSRLFVEGRMEEEIVHDPSKHEGLVQGKLGWNVLTWHGLTPYVAGAVGYKSKATTNFDYYVVEGGVKYPLFANVDLSAATRLRTPFGESSVGGADAYRTVENSVGAKFKLDSKNAVTARYAYEHGDREYHTWGVGFVHAF
jgi:hypothetical protein